MIFVDRTKGTIRKQHAPLAALHLLFVLLNAFAEKLFAFTAASEKSQRRQTVKSSLVSCTLLPRFAADVFVL